MNSYRITWEIDIEADTPEEAAREARRIQKRTDSTATVFEVKDEESGKSITIDLLLCDFAGTEELS